MTTPKKPSYLLSLAETLLPFATATTAVALLGNLWIAALVGVAVGLVLGVLWIRELPSHDARVRTRVGLVLVLGLFVPSCAARTGPHMELLARGVETVSLEEAAVGSREWLRIDGEQVDVRTDLLGHATFDHVDYGISQSYAAPLVPKGWQAGRVEVWLACRGAGDDIPATRAECTRRLLDGPLRLRWVPGEFTSAVEDAANRHHLVADRGPRVYVLSPSPFEDVAEDVVPLLLIVFVSGCLAVMTTFHRRRDMAAAA